MLIKVRPVAPTKPSFSRPALWMSLVIVSLTLSVWAFFASPSFSSSQGLLPNLQPLKASEFRLEKRSGNTYLRFSMTSWNSGAGVLELVARGTSNNTQQIDQRIYHEDGSSYTRYAGNFSWHPLHNHFHVDDYANYYLREAGSQGEAIGTGSKTTFCIIDTDRIDHKLPGASKKRQYTECNKQLQGMSVGWGDTYRYYLAGQEVEVTGLAKGDYELTIKIDPNHNILEQSDTDNSSTVPLYIDVDAGIVQLSDQGNGGGGRRNGRCPRC